MTQKVHCGNPSVLFTAHQDIINAPTRSPAVNFPCNDLLYSHMGVSDMTQTLH